MPLLPSLSYDLCGWFCKYTNTQVDMYNDRTQHDLHYYNFEKVCVCVCVCVCVVKFHYMSGKFSLYDSAG